MSPATKLTEADTVALRRAVETYAAAVNAMSEMNLASSEAMTAELASLRAAKQALRKVNRIRKGSAATGVGQPAAS